MNETKRKISKLYLFNAVQGVPKEGIPFLNKYNSQTT